jgi:hypothetical protein
MARSLLDDGDSKMQSKESDQKESLVAPLLLFDFDFDVVCTGTNQIGPGRAAADCGLLPADVSDARGRRHYGPVVTVPLLARDTSNVL